MSTKLSFSAATAALGRLYDGEPVGPIAAAAGLSDRALLADLRHFVAELCEVVNAARLTSKPIAVSARGGLHGLPQEIGPGERIVTRGDA